MHGHQGICSQDVRGSGQARYEVSTKRGKVSESFHRLAKVSCTLQVFLGRAPQALCPTCEWTSQPWCMSESASVLGLFLEFFEKKTHPVIVRFMSQKTTIKMAVFSGGNFSWYLWLGSTMKMEPQTWHLPGWIGGFWWGQEVKVVKEDGWDKPDAHFFLVILKLRMMVRNPYILLLTSYDLFFMLLHPFNSWLEFPQP